MIFSSDKRIKNKIELVSLHIPKTAGTSFRNSLKEIYGNTGAIRFDINQRTRIIKVEEQDFEAKKMPNEVKVIHGHFHLDHVFEQLKLEKETPIITWMRDPVQRVISNYFYLEKRLKEELNEEQKGLNILEKMQKSLIEYARTGINRNVQARYLAGFPLEKLQFVGIVEHYNSEIQRLQKIMNWPEIAIHKVNVTGSRKHEIPQEWEREIRELNALDDALYQQAVKLREKQL